MRPRAVRALAAAVWAGRLPAPGFRLLRQRRPLLPATATAGTALRQVEARPRSPTLSTPSTAAVAHGGSATRVAGAAGATQQLRQLQLRRQRPRRGRGARTSTAVRWCTCTGWQCNTRRGAVANAPPPGGVQQERAVCACTRRAGRTVEVPRYVRGLAMSA